MKVAFTTLGCKTNQYETSLMEEDLRKEYEIVSFDKEADIYIINTCTVTNKADYQSRQLIRRAYSRKKDAKIIVTGCYAERSPDELKTLSVDSVIVNRDKNNIYGILHGLLSGNKIIADYNNGTFRCKATLNSGRTRAFLKVQDGCNYGCTYCIVPFVRGRNRSAHLETVYQEVKELVKNDYKEIVLSGIQLGSYGRDLERRTDLVGLLKEILKIEGSFRLRLSSIEPNDITPELINLIKNDSRICRHLHIPLQSGDDEILKAMGRNYTSKYFRDLIFDLISEIPDLGIGTDVIVGFPIEKENNFFNTFNMLSKLPLSYFHVFSYSKRPGTSSSMLNDIVSKEEREKRNRLTRALSEEKKLSFRDSQIGKELRIIVEDKPDSKGYLSGLTDNYLRVNIKTSRDFIGEIIGVRIKGSKNRFLEGNPIKQGQIILTY